MAAPVKILKVATAKTKGRFEIGNTVKSNNSLFIREKLINTRLNPELTNHLLKQERRSIEHLENSKKLKLKIALHVEKKAGIMLGTKVPLK